MRILLLLSVLLGAMAVDTSDGSSDGSQSPLSLPSHIGSTSDSTGSLERLIAACSDDDDQSNPAATAAATAADAAARAANFAAFRRDVAHIAHAAARARAPSAAREQQAAAARAQQAAATTAADNAATTTTVVAVRTADNAATTTTVVAVRTAVRAATTAADDSAIAAGYAAARPRQARVVRDASATAAGTCPRDAATAVFPADDQQRHEAAAAAHAQRRKQRRKAVIKRNKRIAKPWVGVTAHSWPDTHPFKVVFELANGSEVTEYFDRVVDAAHYYDTMVHRHYHNGRTNFDVHGNRIARADRVAQMPHFWRTAPRTTTWREDFRAGVVDRMGWTTRGFYFQGHRGNQTPEQVLAWEWLVLMQRWTGAPESWTHRRPVGSYGGLVRIREHSRYLAAPLVFPRPDWLDRRPAAAAPPAVVAAPPAVVAAPPAVVAAPPAVVAAPPAAAAGRRRSTRKKKKRHTATNNTRKKKKRRPATDDTRKKTIPSQNCCQCCYEEVANYDKCHTCKWYACQDCWSRWIRHSGKCFTCGSRVTLRNTGRRGRSRHTDTVPYIPPPSQTIDLTNYDPVGAPAPAPPAAAAAAAAPFYLTTCLQECVDRGECTVAEARAMQQGISEEPPAAVANLATFNAGPDSRPGDLPRTRLRDRRRQPPLWLDPQHQGRTHRNVRTQRRTDTSTPDSAASGSVVDVTGSTASDSVVVVTRPCRTHRPSPVSTRRTRSRSRTPTSTRRTRRRSRSRASTRRASNPAPPMDEWCVDYASTHSTSSDDSGPGDSASSA